MWFHVTWWATFCLTHAAGTSRPLVMSKNHYSKQAQQWSNSIEKKWHILKPIQVQIVSTNKMLLVATSCNIQSVSLLASATQLQHQLLQHGFGRFRGQRYLRSAETIGLDLSSSMSSETRCFYDVFFSGFSHLDHFDVFVGLCHLDHVPCPSIWETPVLLTKRSPHSFATFGWFSGAATALFSALGAAAWLQIMVSLRQDMLEYNHRSVLHNSASISWLQTELLPTSSHQIEVMMRCVWVKTWWKSLCLRIGLVIVFQRRAFGITLALKLHLFDFLEWCISICFLIVYVWMCIYHCIRICINIV